jgi:hypothetical protein
MSRPSLIPDTMEQPMHQPILEPIEKDPETSSNQNPDRSEPNKTANRARDKNSSCRVCLKSFKPDDFSKTCFECKYRVCEDCASYSKMDSTEDMVSC